MLLYCTGGSENCQKAKEHEIHQHCKKAMLAFFFFHCKHTDNLSTNVLIWEAPPSNSDLSSSLVIRGRPVNPGQRSRDHSAAGLAGPAWILQHVMERPSPCEDLWDYLRHHGGSGGGKASPKPAQIQPMSKQQLRN